MSNQRLVWSGLIFAFVLISGPLAEANLIVNGGFEDPQIATAPTFGAWTSLSSATGWFASAGGPNSSGATLISDFDTQYFPDYWAVSEGHQAALFNEFGGQFDVIWQYFPTTIGVTYTVTFDLASERGGPGGPAIDFYAVGQGANISNLLTVFSVPFGSPFAHESISFTAIQAVSQVAFESTGMNGGNAYSPILDNVVVEAASTPEPASLTLVGLGAIGMAVGAIRRRRQYGGNKRFDSQSPEVASVVPNGKWT